MSFKHWFKTSTRGCISDGFWRSILSSVQFHKRVITQCFRWSNARTAQQDALFQTWKIILWKHHYCDGFIQITRCTAMKSLIQVRSKFLKSIRCFTGNQWNRKKRGLQWKLVWAPRKKSSTSILDTFKFLYLTVRKYRIVSCCSSRVLQKLKTVCQFSVRNIF